MRLAIAAALLAIAAGPTAMAQAGNTLLSHGFETADELTGWKKFQEGDTLSIVTREERPTDVRSGQGALCFSFTAKQGKFPAFYSGLPNVSGMKCVDLWLKTDIDTALMLALGERGETEGGVTEDGETYNVVIYTKGGEWTRATVPIEDFQHDEDSPVLNNRLEPEKIHAIALMDALTMFTVGNEELARFLGDHSGPQRVLVDDLRILTAYPGSAAAGAGVVIDSFERNYLSWVPFKNVAMRVAKMRGTTTGRGLRVEYERAADRLNALVRGVPKGSLAGTSELRFKVSSDREIQLRVGVEESDGGKWVTIITVSGGDAVGSYSVSFADMNPAEDTADPDGKLSPQKVNLVSFIDVTQEWGNGWFSIGDLSAR
jgi:hypothetical protein